MDSLTKKLTDAGIKKTDITNCIKAYGEDTDSVKAVSSINAIRDRLIINEREQKNTNSLINIDKEATEKLSDELSSQVGDFVVVDYKDKIENKENVIVNEEPVEVNNINT